MIPSNQISLLSPLLVGIATILCTIIIHALILRVIIRAVRRDLQEGRVGVGFWRDSIFVTNATLLALVGHLLEMGLWARRWGPRRSSRNLARPLSPRFFIAQKCYQKKTGVKTSQTGRKEIHYEASGQQ